MEVLFSVCVEICQFQQILWMTFANCWNVPYQKLLSIYLTISSNQINSGTIRKEGAAIAFLIKTHFFVAKVLSIHPTFFALWALWGVLYRQKPAQVQGELNCAFG